MYDIIGDVHGHADKLEALLRKMGYRERDGVWRHPERKLISVGDLVDRGTQNRRTVDIVRAMQEAGEALVIMGNHEFNAVAWATYDEHGEPLRPHSPHRFEQHEAFLREAEAAPEWYQRTLAWFRSLPLYLELPELHVTHACWHEPSRQIIDAHTDENGALLDHAWQLGARRGHELYDAIEVMAKGWEIELPEGYSFRDKSQHERFHIRTQWWRDDSRLYRDIALGVDDVSNLPSGEVPGSALPGYDHAKPLFLGHYWMKGQPCLQSAKIACVDWSAGKGGPMVAYRFDGESELSNDKFVAAHP
ncbi:metallophosphoesterase [Pseudidiomarina sp.]|uniref:metallophosphoesterase n=1 Tax=Pseudidiomarina sp. TaxID=2081707 RepID=UPI003A96A585